MNLKVRKLSELERVIKDEVNFRPFELEVLHHHVETSSCWHCKFKLWTRNREWSYLYRNFRIA